jgi:hypothetical protein
MLKGRKRGDFSKLVRLGPSLEYSLILKSSLTLHPAWLEEIGHIDFLLLKLKKPLNTKRRNFRNSIKFEKAHQMSTNFIYHPDTVPFWVFFLFQIRGGFFKLKHA